MTDQIIRLDGLKTKYQYPENLRRVTYHDAESGNDFVFYTNNRDVSAEQVALLYRYRWRVELFFKWMKQHLHIKEFFGHNEMPYRFRSILQSLRTVSWLLPNKS